MAAVVLLVVGLFCSCSKSGERDDFTRVMNTGKNYYDQGEAEKAIASFRQAVELGPTRPDAHLNLANACLLGNQPEEAATHAREVLNYNRNSAAAYYVAGCAYLRRHEFENGLQMLQSARDLDAGVPAVSFQIGAAHLELQHLDEAIAAFEETLQLEPKHPVAHYALSQALIRAGRREEGMAEIEKHNAILAGSSGAPAGPETFERCKHTVALAPIEIQKPDKRGIAVRFVDATTEAFGGDAAKYRGPLAVLDYNHDDRNSLFVIEDAEGFRLLDNQNGRFTPKGPPWKMNAEGGYRQALVGDLNNDRFEDIVVLGETASQAFRFATNGVARDWTAASGLKRNQLLGRYGALVDLDFTGKLDLVVVLPGGEGIRVLRNLGNMYFKDITSTSGVPRDVRGVRQLAIDDWNNDDLLDVIASRDDQRPLYLEKVRGGTLVATNLPSGRIDGPALALGDVNGDSRVDLLAGSTNHVDLLLGGVNRFKRLPLSQPGLVSLTLVDFDNDGWLDLLAAGEGLRIWRNVGDGEFEDATVRLGLDKLDTGRIEHIVAADFDRDGDTDLVTSAASGGIRMFRNDGGNANYQLKLRLIGARSNASGLGIRVEVAAGTFRVHRTVSSLPIEIGVGQHRKLDSLTARWFDLAFNQIDVEPDPKNALIVFEPQLPTGSCPYLYAWDGEGFRFVTDMLGSAPVGLRVSETVFVEADPHEYLWLGDEAMFPPHKGQHLVRITEELREVLYLDEAKLVVVDHPPGTEVHTTDKLLPRKPFPRGELWTLENRQALLRASSLDGDDVTGLLRETDRRMVSPVRLRVPQLRGLAEPHGVVLDFGPLATDRPLVLALTGWLRFGGGMANVAASHDPDLPFPFPQLEVETVAGEWRPVEVVVGAPSGKTKTILVDLAEKLPPGSRRLKLVTAYEIHWDRIALFERRLQGDTRIGVRAPVHADLHWRGFSEFADLPWSQPLTPVYGQVFQTPHWVITPRGWCTRYGPVHELIASEDNAVAILNGGDELTLGFPVDRLPPKAPGLRRDFFLYGVGWDKDADFHVELGWKVDPLPWHGMDDQRYGREPRPEFATDELMRRYNTRWVPQHTLERVAAR